MATSKEILDAAAKNAACIVKLEVENEQLRELLQETIQPLYKTYNSDCLGPKSLPCRIEKTLKGK